eukprot:3722912-Rhodomonas_salina.1
MDENGRSGSGEVLEERSCGWKQCDKKKEEKLDIESTCTTRERGREEGVGVEGGREWVRGRPLSRKRREREQASERAHGRERERKQKAKDWKGNFGRDIRMEENTMKRAEACKNKWRENGGSLRKRGGNKSWETCSLRSRTEPGRLAQR